MTQKATTPVPPPTPCSLNCDQRLQYADHTGRKTTPMLCPPCLSHLMKRLPDLLSQLSLHTAICVVLQHLHLETLRAAIKEQP